MTVRKLSISVPPDVAQRLDQEENASKFLVDTVRTRIRAEQLAAELAHQGITTTPEGRATAAARRAAADRAIAENINNQREHVRQAAHNPTTPPARQPAA